MRTFERNVRPELQADRRRWRLCAAARRLQAFFWKAPEARSAPSTWDRGAALGSPQPERPNAQGGAMGGEMGGANFRGLTWVEKAP